MRLYPSLPRCVRNDSTDLNRFSCIFHWSHDSRLLVQLIKRFYHFDCRIEGKMCCQNKCMKMFCNVKKDFTPTHIRLTPTHTHTHSHSQSHSHSAKWHAHFSLSKRAHVEKRQPGGMWMAAALMPFCAHCVVAPGLSCYFGNIVTCLSARLSLHSAIYAHKRRVK